MQQLGRKDSMGTLGSQCRNPRSPLTENRLLIRVNLSTPKKYHANTAKVVIVLIRQCTCKHETAFTNLAKSILEILIYNK